MCISWSWQTQVTSTKQLLKYSTLTMRKRRRSKPKKSLRLQTMQTLRVSLSLTFLNTWRGKESRLRVVKTSLIVTKLLILRLYKRSKKLLSYLRWVNSAVMVRSWSSLVQRSFHSRLVRYSTTSKKNRRWQENGFYKAKEIKKLMILKLLMNLSH